MGIAAGTYTAWAMLGNDARHASPLDVALVLTAGWAFVLSGLIAWRLRPDNLIGPALIATGLLRFVEGPTWSQDAVIFAFGHALGYLYIAAIVFVLLAFPTGRLATATQRGLFAAALIAVGPVQVAWLLTGGHERSGSCAGCPPNLLEVVHAPDLAGVLQVAQLVIGAIVGACALAVLVRRWRSATAPVRFAITPVLWAGAATAAALLTMVLNHLLGEPLGRLPHVAIDVALVLVAVAFLAGVARMRLARAGVTDLLRELAAAPAEVDLRAALARAVRDPSLEIAFWLPADRRYVDAAGRQVTLPESDPDRAVTLVERQGRRIAALIHDPSLIDDESLILPVALAAALELENRRLQADLRAQLAEVRASRARIVEAAQDERRRIERDLHDGTQQRLVSVSMTLGLVEAKVRTDPEAATDLVCEAQRGLSAALQELRELSQGIHPGVLTERGLEAAVDDLALRMHLPIDVEIELPQRLPIAVETAAYYVISEGLTNVVKHAGARRIRVGVGTLNDCALVSVSDDGRGGADPAHGSGLRGLRDRVEALGGRLALESARGSGTRLMAEIPCE